MVAPPRIPAWYKKARAGFSFELGSLLSWLGISVFEAVAWESFSMFRTAGRCGCWAV